MRSNSYENNVLNNVELPFHESLITQNLKNIPSEELPSQMKYSLVQSELSFLYSTQLYAERNGELALQQIRETSKKTANQNKIIDMQIFDEIRHAQMLDGIVEKIGLDTKSTSFANGYVDILSSVGTLSEKIFVFHIMTESISSAYLDWRLRKIKNKKINQIDQSIFNDEIRHLKMGHALLNMCDQEELDNVLVPDRKKELLRQVSRMCSQHFLNGVQRIATEHGIESRFRHKVTDLDRMVARAILAEI